MKCSDDLRQLKQQQGKVGKELESPVDSMNKHIMYTVTQDMQLKKSCNKLHHTATDCD